MKADLLAEMVRVFTEQDCGHEPHRHYLQMSQIDRCPRALYRLMVSGGDQPDRATLIKFQAGFVWEREILRRLRALELLDEQHGLSVHASFDDRFQGHVDAVLTDRTLVEIKSTVAEDLQRLIAQNTVKRPHMMQVQMYMEHGRFPRAVLFYVARDTGLMHAWNVPRIDALVMELNDKARRVLAAIDAHCPPVCECGRCNHDALRD